MELQFPLILDGATGTQLQKRGYTNEQCAEQWVLEHPEAIQDIQKNYVAAGSNIVYASTFGANRIKLEGNGIRNQTAAYNTRLVGLSREAVGENAMVAGDIAPTGKFLYPIGDLSFENLLDVYTEQAQALEQAGVDLFVIETTMTIPEARAALLAVKSVSEKPVFVTFTCDENGKTLTGTDVVAALVIMQSMGADAVGLNCSVGPDQMLLQLERMAQYAQVPLIAKPNAGIPEMVDGKAVYTCTPEEFAALVPEMAAAGVGVYGGCCGSEPAHIAALAQAVKQAEIKKPASKHMDELVAATEREVFVLPTDVDCGDVFPCDEDVMDAIEEAEDSEDAVLSIRIEEADELENFAEGQYAIVKPLCLHCEDAALLEQALRLYQGRALYTGSLSKDELQPLCEKYGLLVR